MVQHIQQLINHLMKNYNKKQKFLLFKYFSFTSICLSGVEGPTLSAEQNFFGADTVGADADAHDGQQRPYLDPSRRHRQTWIATFPGFRPE